MEKKKVITRIEITVIIIVILFIIAILLPAQGRVKKIAMRVVCGTNLKGLGAAMAVYSSDYDTNYPQLPGKGLWSKTLGFDYDLKEPDFDGAQSDTPRTITSSLFFLVTEADMSPKSFICPESNEWEFDGQNSNNLDIIELWDFGSESYKHVSYAYQNPYGQFPANDSRSASFVVMADMNPWFFEGDIIESGQNPRAWEDELPKNTTLEPPQIIGIDDTSLWKLGNTSNHFRADRWFAGNYKFGQNILYNDGHVDFVRHSNVGVKNDNIYSFWSTEENPTEQDIQGGTAPTSRSAENDAKSKDDSFLAI